jgi:MFS family permease
MVLSSCFVAAFSTFPGHSFGWAFFLPSIEAELGIHREQTGLMWTISCLLTAPTMIVGGHLVNAWGQKKVLAFSASLFVGTIAAVGHVQNFEQLCVCSYVLRFTGPGLIFLCCNTTVGKWFKESRGVASFVFISNLWCGLCFQNVAAMLLHTYGWRKSYSIMATGFGALLLPSVCFHADEPAPAEPAAPTPAVPAPGTEDKGKTREEAPLLGSSARVMSIAQQEVEEEERSTGGEDDKAQIVGASDPKEVVITAAAPEVSLSLSQCTRLPIFWAVLIGQCVVETVFVGSQYHIVSLLGESKAALQPAQVAKVQSIAAVIGILISGITGVVVDTMERQQRLYDQRLVLALALLAGGGGLATLMHCYHSLSPLPDVTMFLPSIFCASLAAMGGASDIGTSTLYAALFGPEYLGAILGLASGLTHVAVALGPLLYGVVHRQAGSFLPVLCSLASWTVLSALCILCSPPPGPPPAEEKTEVETPAQSWRQRKRGWKQQQQQRLHCVAPEGTA